MFAEPVSSSLGGEGWCLKAASEAQGSGCPALWEPEMAHTVPGRGPQGAKGNENRGQEPRFLEAW